MLHITERFRREQRQTADELIPIETRLAVAISPDEIVSFLRTAKRSRLWLDAKQIGCDMVRLGCERRHIEFALITLREDSYRLWDECPDEQRLNVDEQFASFHRDRLSTDKLIIDCMDDARHEGWAPPPGIRLALCQLETVARAKRDAIEAAYQVKREAEFQAELARQESIPMPANLSVVPSAPLPDLIKSSAEFVQGFVPPEYLLDGVLQRRFCYSITAQTGVGKTTVAMLLAVHVALGRKLGSLDVEKGAVLYFAGENPTDVQMRWIGLCHEMKIDPATTDVHFLAGTLPLSQYADRITSEIVRKGLQPALVIVDTAAAYNEGDDENSNTQAGEHARRLRSLTLLPGGPCVLILCHPTKRAGDDDLIPRGGGAFLAEVDGNIALQKADRLVAATAQGKFRGREFAPLSFELKTVFPPMLKDARGREIPTVVATAIGEAGHQATAAVTRSNEDFVLRAIFDHPDASLADLAKVLGWTFGRDNLPDKMKVKRAADSLAGSKLLAKYREGWMVTSKGQKELNRLDAIKAQSPPLPSPRMG